ncbi:MAG TPA: beta-N-acetylhexosaminidase, partial [Pseudomonadales bacterium]|nr:beta-N-acetylhexosaminidase [Pseudomonadales bacterium]
MPFGSVMLDLRGTQIEADEIDLLQHPQTGGVILFSRNVDTPAQVAALCAAIRAVRPEILIAVDQEGGRVARFRQGFSSLPPMRVLGKLYDQNASAALHLAEQCGWLMATEVLSVGVDISFAPVLDVDTGNSAVIGDRAFHANPIIASELILQFINGMHRAGMKCTGKHFPGHGSVAADSHHAVPVDERELSEIRVLDLIPFKLLSAQLDAVMPAHVIYSKVDPHPAGFSSFWLQTVLRQELAFDGVIFSDDLCMEGASVAGSFGERAHAAMKAGCDMVLVCNNQPAAKEVLAALQDQP